MELNNIIGAGNDVIFLKCYMIIKYGMCSMSEISNKLDNKMTELKRNKPEIPGKIFKLKKEVDCFDDYLDYELENDCDFTLSEDTLVTLVDSVAHGTWYVQEFAHRFMSNDKLFFISSVDWKHLEEIVCV